MFRETIGWLMVAGMIASVLVLLGFFRSRWEKSRQQFQKDKDNTVRSRKKILDSLRVKREKTLWKELDNGGRAEFDRDLAKRWETWSLRDGRRIRRFHLGWMGTSEEELAILCDQSHYKAQGRQALKRLRDEDNKAYASSFQWGREIKELREAAEFLGVSLEYFGSSEGEMAEFCKQDLMQKARGFWSRMRDDTNDIGHYLRNMKMMLAEAKCNLSDIGVKDEEALEVLNKLIEVVDSFRGVIPHKYNIGT